MPEKFVDENATITDEKKKRLEEEKEKNKLRTKWDNGVAFYQFQSQRESTLTHPNIFAFVKNGNSSVILYCI